MRFDATKLKLSMAERGVNVRQLSSAADVTPPTIAKARAGKDISGETVVKICKALNVDAADLLLNE